MIVFPNCKINLGLHITGKRADGYHNLQTIFYPVLLQDILEILPTPAATETTFTPTGLPIAGDRDSNLCLKAYNLLKQDFPILPFVQIHLHKTIPMGAGLGGGSADGAFTLVLLNKKFDLKLSQQQLIDYALQLGSDCPFFIINKPSYAEGRGELLQPVELNLSAYNLVIVNPGIHVNTGWAFAQLQPATPAKSLQEIIQQPITTWKDELLNNFEAPVAKAHPAIADIKTQLYQQGAVYASMTGSGSTVFGLFEKGNTPSFQFPKDYLLKII